jgi:pilus assembly protein CpaE
VNTTLSGVLVFPRPSPVPKDDTSHKEKVLPDVPNLIVQKVLDQYPSAEVLIRVIRLQKLDLLILSAEDLSAFESLASQIDHLFRGFPIIALTKDESLETLSLLMRLGVREYLNLPVDAERLKEAVERIRKHLAKHPPVVPRTSDVYAFLPARPGVGATTLAVGTAHAAAEELGVHSLLVDCDLAAGPIRFLLKLKKTASILDAVNHANSLDEDLWTQMLGKFGKLEVLHAGDLTYPPSIDLEALRHVISMARSLYEIVCADLPSAIDPFTLTWMKEARRIFLVTTPEVASLHFAKERLGRLREVGLEDRVRLLLNRKVSNKFGEAEVAEAVGIPVSRSFTNDYQSVQSAILEASPVRTSSDLTQSILNLAQSLSPGAEPRQTTSGTRKFLEFFKNRMVQEDPDTIWKD